MFLDKIPDSAAVNESVNIVKASKDNWQTLMINFDATDLSAATYIAVQYYSKAGAPGMT